MSAERAARRQARRRHRRRPRHRARDRARASPALGASLTLLGRDATRLRRCRDSRCRRCDAQVCDVADAAAVHDAFARSPRAGHRIAILVNNAGVAQSAKFAATDAALWDAMLRVNLTGTFHCTQAALPALLAAPHGRIVNVASTAGLTGYPYVAAYCAAKHGVVGLTRALALELASTHVTVNAVCPGYTDTDIVGDAVANIVAKTGRSADDGARGARGAQPAAAPGHARRGRGRRRVAVPARVSGDHRAGDRRVRRRGDELMA